MSAELDSGRPPREVCDELHRLGFKDTQDGSWSGTVETAAGPITVDVSLPSRFPISLPEVRIRRKELPRRVPHVEADGKICLPQGQGTLIDGARPADIVAETIELATKVLQKGLSGEADDDFIEEFLAYWEHETLGVVHSICAPNGPSRRVSLLSSGAPWNAADELLLLADTDAAGREWLSRAGGVPRHVDPAWFFRLQSAFIPPDFEARMTTRGFLNIVRPLVAPAEYECFREFRKSNQLPITAVLSMPAASTGEILAAMRFERPRGDNQKEALKGYRPGRVPAWKEFSCIASQAITRPKVVRLDTGFIMPRGGADGMLANKRVLVLGIGAVGSRLAEKLAVLGVGFLRLVDKEAMGAENLHRHVLGFESLSINKALAMRMLLERRFPHIAVEAKDMLLEGTASQVDELLDGTDFVCVAVGDETLELRLNDMLSNKRPRLHVWVEPIGVGAHVLLTGVEPAGCFRCLFEHDERAGFRNRSAFAAPGQRFAKTFSGCAGTFTPFSGLDADRAAAEAAEMTVRVLAGQQTRNVLVSRFGNPDEYIRAGFHLSQRAALFQPTEVIREPAFAEPTCPCAAWEAK